MLKYIVIKKYVRGQYSHMYMKINYLKLNKRIFYWWINRCVLVWKESKTLIK